MAHYRASIHIPQPREDVFAYLSDRGQRHDEKRAHSHPPERWRNKRSARRTGIVPTSRITGPTSRIAEADERDRQQTPLSATRAKA